MKIVMNLLGADSLPLRRKLVVYQALLEALVVVNTNYLLQNPGVPSIRECVQHRLLAVERSATETWRDIPAILGAGRGSMTDLACWRVAELRQAGENEVAPFLWLVRSEHGDSEHEHFEVRVRRGLELEDPTAGIPAAKARDTKTGGN